LQGGQLGAGRGRGERRADLGARQPLPAQQEDSPAARGQSSSPDRSTRKSRDELITEVFAGVLAEGTRVIGAIAEGRPRAAGCRGSIEVRVIYGEQQK